MTPTKPKPKFRNPVCSGELAARTAKIRSGASVTSATELDLKKFRTTADPGELAARIAELNAQRDVLLAEGKIQENTATRVSYITIPPTTPGETIQ